MRHFLIEFPYIPSFAKMRRKQTWGTGVFRLVLAFLRTSNACARQQSHEGELPVYPLRSHVTMDERQQLHEAAFGDSPSLMLGDELIVPDLEVADRMFSRMKGLLGRKMLLPTDGLHITPCKSIHMFFMRFAIDAVFIDRNGYVVRVYHHLQPWRMAKGGKHAYSVFELPAGRAGQFNIRVGDKLTFG